MITPAPEVLAAGTASPASIYVYDLARLRRRCQMLTEMAVGPKRIFFATMANDHPVILACIRDSGLGAFVNSRPHLDLVLGLGFPPQRVVYAASNMSSAEIADCVALGVHLVLDSLGQLSTVCDVVGKRAAGPGSPTPLPVGLRLNVGNAVGGASFHSDPGYRFGLLPYELTAAEQIVQDHGVQIAGLHAYFGTDIMQSALLLQGLDLLGRAGSRLPHLRYLDVAGGFGVPDTLTEPDFDLASYARGAASVMDRHRSTLGRPLELYVEPGRYLVADSGYYFAKVVDVKLRRDRVFVGTNGSVAEFPRPLLYPDRARHPCEIVNGPSTAATHRLPVYVCGNTTYSQDFLARAVAMPLPARGDTLVFHHAGAYGRSMATRFLGRKPPAETFINRSVGAVSDAPVPLGTSA